MTLWTNLSDKSLKDLSVGLESFKPVAQTAPYHAQTWMDIMKFKFLTFFFCLVHFETCFTSLPISYVTV